MAKGGAGFIKKERQKEKTEIPDAPVSEMCVLKRDACIFAFVFFFAACVRDKAGTKDAGLDYMGRGETGCARVCGAT